ncbi:MAG: hypothetical protein H6811_06130 [Phycisphaeraceae bacterium]|nr:hypothetical protein [Phycisphaeraceae bacterium]
MSQRNRNLSLILAVALVLGLAACRAGAEDGEPPTPSACYEVFAEVESRVLAWSDHPVATRIPIAGAQITLRLDGALVGRGQSMQGDTDTIFTALRGAMREAERRLPVARDALFEDMMRAHASRMTIGIEFAGETTPMSPDALEDVTLALSPGLDGVCVRAGSRIEAMFPTTMLWAGIGPGSAMRAVLSELSGDPSLALRPPRELGTRHGITFAWFRVRHLQQLTAGRPPEFLTRGGRVVEQRDLRSAELRAFAEGIAAYLIGQTSRTIVGAELAGGYRPVLGEDSGPASAMQRALVSAALARFAASDGGATEAGRVAQETASALLENIAALNEREPVAGDAGLAALVELALAWHPSPPESERLTRLRRDAAVTLRAVLSAPNQVSPSVESIAVCAMAVGGIETDAIRERMRTLMTTTDLGHIVSLMPWLGWAELALSGNDGVVPSGAGLRQLREVLWTHQLTANDTGPRALDLVGGIVFTASNTPLPSWHTSRPLALMASMLGDPRLTPESEVPHELARLLVSVRFLRQLAADGVVCHAFAAPDRARWGIRSAVWDQRMPPEASAMTLLTLTELLDSLEAIAARRNSGS